MSWSPPAVGRSKLNSDGSCLREMGLAGYGGVVRNDIGTIVVSFAGPLWNGSIIDAELHALWRGVSVLKELGVVENILEGDSKIVVGWATGFLCP